MKRETYLNSYFITLLFILTFSSFVSAVPPTYSITSVSPGSGNTLKVGDVLTVTITADGAETGLEASGNQIINGVDVTASFSESGGGVYTLEYTVAEGNGDINEAQISATIQLQNGEGPGNVINSIAQEDAPNIDANTPTITTKTIDPDSGTRGIGDSHSITFTAGSSETGLTLGTCTVNVVDVTASFSDNLDGTYSLTYTVAEGHTDRTGGTMPISCQIQDAAGNVVTVSSFDSNTLVIDATYPVVDSFSCNPLTVHQGEVITCSCTASDTNLDTTSYATNPATTSPGTLTTTCTATDTAENSASSNIEYIVQGSGGGDSGGSSAGGGGGGGSSGSYTPPKKEVEGPSRKELFGDHLGDLIAKENFWKKICTSRWDCSDWGKCTDGVQRKTCIDVNNCFVPTGRPPTVRSCDETCNENWICEWTSCTEGVTVPTCTDSNECGTEFDIPREISCGSNKNSVCIPNIECGEWSNCLASYSLSNLESSSPENLISGMQTRICVDKKGCINSVREEQSCVLSTDIDTKIIEACGKEYVWIFDKLERTPILSLIIENRRNPILDIRLIGSDGKHYCDSCYNGIKDENEEEIDCGGDGCISCEKLSQMTPPEKENLWKRILRLFESIK